MKPQQIEFAVYLVGVVLFGVTYYWFKQLVAGPVFLVGALGYLVALRLLGRYLAKRSTAKVAGGDSDV